MRSPNFGKVLENAALGTRRLRSGESTNPPMLICCSFFTRLTSTSKSTPIHRALTPCSSSSCRRSDRISDSRSMPGLACQQDFTPILDQLFKRAANSADCRENLPGFVRLSFARFSSFQRIAGICSRCGHCIRDQSGSQWTSPDRNAR